MKKIFSFAGLLAAVGILAFAPIAATTVKAAEFIRPDETSGNVTLSATETHRNVYTAGGTLFVNSKTEGDLYAGGGSVTIEGSVEQDLVLAGGDIGVNGPVGGDIRIAGGTVIINNTVGGDILIAGGTVHLTEKSVVAGDILIAGGQVIVDGAVTGNVCINGGDITLNSKINGKVKIIANNSFTLGSKAEISNTITYEGVNEQVVKEGAKVGTIDYKKIEKRSGAGRAFAGIFTLMFVIKIVASILAGLLLMKLLPRTAHEAVDAMGHKMWANLGLGALGLIVVPILSVILMVIFVGFYIGMMAMLIWGLMLMLSMLVAAVFVGAWIITKLTKNGSMKYDWQSLVIGVVVLELLSLIPFIGALAVFILVLMAFGGLIRQFYGRIKSEQAAQHDNAVIINN